MSGNRKFINQIEPFIDSSELDYLTKVIESTFVTEHTLTKEFENLFKDYTGSKHVIAYTNGTLALYAILKSLGIGPGDEVIVPDLTFIATANSVILAGATPVLCDIETENYGLDLQQAEKLISKNTRAIIPVHLYGLSCKIDEIRTFSEKHNLFLVEDAAQGVGVRYSCKIKCKSDINCNSCDDGNVKHVGTFGDAGILSFYGNKTMTCGEGGLILTDNDEIAKKCYRLKNHGRDVKGIFKHESIGFNFSFTEMQAAIGIAQFKKLNSIINKKEEIYNRYFEELSGLKDIKMNRIPENINPVHWFTNIFINDVDHLSKFLKEKGIGTRRFFYPLHLQPCYSDFSQDLNSENFKNSLKSYNTALSLPSLYSLTNEDQKYIIKTIKSYYE
ncbi:MAG: DegT/DnrJ/EryC1/StrS family aminotransferase [Candidatus Neomarinimicrobiota bacterium]|nr:DegT/DnrJ/EryC1/StrS family aminotransferase [Candidatus Neomarinimicrobiota bacterium]